MLTLIPLRIFLGYPLYPVLRYNVLIVKLFYYYFIPTITECLLGLIHFVGCPA